MTDQYFHNIAERAARRLVNLHPHPDPCIRFDAVLSLVLKAIEAAATADRERLLSPGRN